MPTKNTTQEELQQQIEDLRQRLEEFDGSSEQIERLSDSEQRLSVALETAQTGAWELNLEDHTAHRSLQHDRIFGYKALLPVWTYEMFLEHVLPEDRGEVDRLYRQAVDSGGDWSFECRIRRTDGEIRWIWAAGHHQRDASGTARRMAGIVQDITRRKAAEESLLEGKSKLELALQSADMGAWELDLNKQKRHFDEQVCHCLGIDRSRFEGTAEEFYAAVHPDDRQTIKTALETSIATGIPYEGEYRVIWPDGSAHHIATRGRLLKNSKGMPQRISGVIWDVTERKQAEEVLALAAAENERQRQLLEVTLASIGDAVIVTDVEGRVSFLNGEAERLTGWKPNEAADRPMAEIFRIVNERTRETVESPVAKVLRTGGVVGSANHTILISKDGQETAIDDSGAPVRSDDGTLYGVVVVFRDISARRQAEEQLHKAHEELEQKIRERTEELRQANRTLRMTSECNQILVRAKGEQELMEDICRIIIDIGGYRMAWVGYAEDNDGKTVRAVASLGFEEGYLKKARISWADNERGRGPTGKCIRTGDICVGRNFLEDQELAPWRDEALKRGFRSSIALPLKSDGKAFGAITIYAQEPYAFDQGRELLRELADDLAFGIAFIRAQEERDRARAIAEKRAGQLQALAAELVQTEQKERRQLAKILHDHLQQLLVGAKFGASLIQAKAQSKIIEETAIQLIETLDESIRASRSLSAELSPPVLHERGLAAGLKWLGRQMLEKHGLTLEIEAEETAEPSSEQVRIFLFEAVRELLLNIVKHAKVNRAQIRLQMLESGEIEVLVADDGAGFDPARAESITSTTGGFGLFSVRERLSYLGGRMVIDAAPGRGSRFTLVAPARLASQSAKIRHHPY